PPPGQPVLLLGMGGVGLMAMALAKSVLPNPIIAADIDENKREAALKYGAVEAIEPTAEAWQAIVARHGAAVAAIDFVGAPATFGFGTAALRRGGKYIIVGLFGGKANLPLASLPLKPFSIIGSYVGRLDEARELIALMRAGAIPAPPMHERPLAEANSAIDDLRAGKVSGRVLQEPNPPLGPGRKTPQFATNASGAKQVGAADLKSVPRTAVRVQPPPLAPAKSARRAGQPPVKSRL